MEPFLDVVVLVVVLWVDGGPPYGLEVSVVVVLVCSELSVEGVLAGAGVAAGAAATGAAAAGAGLAGAEAAGVPC